jgi:hypothetical protein
VKHKIFAARGLARFSWPCVALVQCTDHDLIPARNASLGDNARYLRAEVILVITQRENIRPSKREMNKAITMQYELPDVCSYAMNNYVSLSLNSRKSSVHLHALYSPRITLRTFTPRRDHQLVICGLYIVKPLTQELKSGRQPRSTLV